MIYWEGSVILGIKLNKYINDGNVKLNRKRIKTLLKEILEIKR